MEGLEFDDEPMGVWNFEEGDNNYKGARERFAIFVSGI